MNFLPTIAIYTFTMGRWRYLRRAIESVLAARREYLGPSRHIVCFQGCVPPGDFAAYEALIEMKVWPENYGIASGINRVGESISEDLTIKFDDDCEIVSSDFLSHVAEISRLCSGAVFSPYPVGLIGNPGGVLSNERKLAYSDRLDVFYTLRCVPHVGGLCRISPSRLTNWQLHPDLGIPGASGNEDGQFSTLCRTHQIPMYYLENAIIVEHQESTLGQHARYGKEYFGERF